MPTEISGSTGVNKIQDNTIVNADINSSAAIAGSKISGGVGKVLQVVISEHSTQTTLSTDTYTDIGHSATITPSSTASKILVMWRAHARTSIAGSGFGTKLVRGSTAVWTSNSNYSQYYANAGEIHSSHNISYIDSPSTTSATTYKLQASSYGSNLIKMNSDGEKTQIVLMEIAG